MKAIPPQHIDFLRVGMSFFVKFFDFLSNVEIIFVNVEAINVILEFAIGVILFQKLLYIVINKMKYDDDYDFEKEVS